MDINFKEAITSLKISQDVRMTLKRPSTAPPPSEREINRILASFSAKNRMTVRNIVKATIAKAVKNKTAKAKKRRNVQTRRNGRR